jgi:hypothetical protein
LSGILLKPFASFTK